MDAAYYGGILYTADAHNQEIRGGIQNALYLCCLGSIGIAILRFETGKPFPTALCLLMIVGLLGFMYKMEGEVLTKRLKNNLLLFEGTLLVASFLSYGEKVVWYFIAYNIGMACFYLFERKNIGWKPAEKLGELGFTFFLGARIPIGLCAIIIPAIAQLDCYSTVLLKFILSIIFSYVVTTYVERPLLQWGKKIERKII